MAINLFLLQLFDKQILNLFYVFRKTVGITSLNRLETIVFKGDLSSVEKGSISIRKFIIS
jgi:hypothetical protein